MGTGRLEPLPRNPDIEEGLDARVFDPLWLLGRQWQLGEFQGDDAGTPYVCDITGDAHLVTGWRPAADIEPGPWQRFDPVTTALETLVEAEPAHEAASTALRVEGGRRLWAALVADGRANGAAALTTACPWNDNGAIPAHGVAALVRRRVPDGRAIATLARSLASEANPAARLGALGVAAADAAPVIAHLRSWLDWWTPRAEAVGEEAADFQPPAWNVPRLEYSFDLTAPTAPAPVLRAPSYRSGRFDWADVDLADGDLVDVADGAAPTTGSPPGSAVPIAARSIPAPATFAGMPANRFWQLEDALVDFGRADASAFDLGRLLLVQFTTVYGNDWSVVPLRLPAGSLTVISGFKVTTVFGETVHLAPCAAADPAWRVFSVGGTDEVATRSFFLAPSLVGGLDGPPLERVQFGRDEMADLAWAVESIVPDAAAQQFDRVDAWTARSAATPPPADLPRYLVTTDVPDHWFPLAPEPIGTSGSNRLRLTTLRTGTPDPTLPHGAVLADRPPPSVGGERMWVFDAEVTRAGIEVTRAPQLARTPRGGTRIWVGRSAATGKGQVSSGLRWDELENP